MQNILEKIFLKPKTFIFFFSFLICIIFYLLIPESYKNNESSDYISFYEPVAKNIAYKGFFIDDIENLGFRYPPGFSIILAVIFILSDIFFISHENAVFIFSILCISFSSIIIYLISKNIFGEKKALIAPILFTTYPLLLWTIKQPNSESPFMLLILYSLYIIQKIFNNNEKKYEIYILGFTIAYSILIRPIAILLPLIVIFFFILHYLNSKKTKTIKYIIAFSVICFITLLPWEIYAYSKINKVILISTSGGAGIYDGLTYNINLKKYREKIQYSDEIENLMIRIKEKTSLKSKPSEVLSVVIYEFYNNPIDVIKLYLIKFSRAFYATDSQRNENIIFIIQVFYLNFLFICLFLFYKYKKQNLLFNMFILCTFFYFIAMSTIALSIVRYIVPVTSYLFIFTPIVFLKKEN